MIFNQAKTGEINQAKSDNKSSHLSCFCKI